MSFHLSRLNLLHFRNHREAEVELGPEVNCFVGPNGVGKTNLLDAVHYLALGKSYFDAVDMHNILRGEELFMLQGIMTTSEGEDAILCSVRKGSRKIMSRNRKEYDRLADHVGRYPVVMITPFDGQLVLEGSEVRRRFLDGLIAQFDKTYLEALIRYNRDRAAQHTTVGIHKDDLVFTLDGEPLKRFGSQGQQKTYLIALKLAQFDLTQARSGNRPILLLDDIFDKIDPQRMRHLLKLLSDQRFGQVLITDTDASRLHKALDGLDLDTRFFQLTHEGITREKAQRTVAR